MTTITRKYDKLRNLISERVDRYTIEYDKAKDREVRFSTCFYTIIKSYSVSDTVLNMICCDMYIYMMEIVLTAVRKRIANSS